LIQIKAACRHCGFADALQQFARSIAMLDVVMLAIGFVSFALLIGYAYACDQL